MQEIDVDSLAAAHAAGGFVIDVPESTSTPTGMYPVPG